MDSVSTRGQIEPDIREQYERNGYYIFRGVIDTGLAAEARGHVDWLLARYPDLRPEQLGNQLMTDDPFWVRLVGDDRLLDVAQRFIGPDIALFASHYIAKPPGTGQAVLWHQDGSFWPLEPMEVVTVWLAADRVTPENGCMRVIPGTHRMDLQQIRRRTDVANVLSAEIDVDPSSIDEDRAVDIVLEPGDVEVHHPNIIHGSHANTSASWRRGLTIRYIPTTTRIVTDAQWPSAFLLRGTAPDGVNDYRPRPRYREGVHMRFEGCERWA